MFRTKKDVERHVSDVLSKIDNENEKNLRGYTFARLYFQVKDYESAKRYLTGFLGVRDHHAASHKLMAQIYDATNNPESALQSYKRSLEIDARQNDIVLKICDLYCQLPVDHETARYWADRAEQLFPHHETIFKLREYLVSAEGEPDRQELENLIASELAAQPKNIDLRIKLLRLYLDTERVKEAYDHATLIESKRLFPYSVDWYYLLGDIFEAYQEEYNDLDPQFYIHYLTALDHLMYLTLAEPHAFLENGRKSSSLNDAAAVLLTFDQLLKKAVEQDITGGSWRYFTHHMRGQLYFHMTSLLMKRAKMDQGNRKEAFRFTAGLAVVCYTFKHINLLQEVWFLQMEDNQKAFTNFFQKGALRTSFIGHVLLTLCKEDKSSWLQKIKTEVCIPQVKERIYNRIFTITLNEKEKLSSSFFITDPTFEQCSLELPTEVVLKENDKSAYKLCADSLHHLVWLELHGENTSNPTHDNITEIFQNLQYSNKNLSKGSCESLCVLDLESYLYASVYQSKFIIQRRSNVHNARNDSLLSYPPDVADALCTKVQATWWKSAHGLYTCGIKEKLGEHRRNLQQGLEVIRGIGNHGMEVQLAIYLAHTFCKKADTLDKNSETIADKKKKNKLTSDCVAALYFRATHYWNIALGMLEKNASGQTLKTPQDPMFSGSSKPLSKNEIKDYQEEGHLFLAVRLMNSDKLNEAAELLSKLSSPYGSYYLALTLKKLASQEERYSSTRTGLLVKAQSALHDTMDRIKDDKSHPLNKELFIELEDVENDLGLEHSNVSECKSEGADETDAYDGSSIHNASYSWQENHTSAVHSTPRPSAKFMTSKHSVINQESPTRHFEPSPERLDAQIRALALNQDSLVKSFLQQQETLLETNKSIVGALKQIKDVVGEFKKQLEELSLNVGKHRTKTVPKRPGYLKGQGDEEEDYYDPNGIILEYYEDGGEDFRASGYSFDHSSRIVHEAPPGASAPLNYVVSPALPPGPPPTMNHYNYQYPPHAVLPTPPAVAERPPYYHPPPGQGLPFSEGQQLPQFHFHVASSIVKPPTAPTLTTSLPPMVPGLTPVSVPPPPVSVPPPMPPVAPPPWPKTISVPHAFQIPLPSSTIFVSAASAVATTPIAPSVSVTAASHSQLKDLLQTPVSKTISFGQPLTATSPAALNTSPSLFSGLAQTPKNHSRCDSESAASPDVDGHDLEREVMGDFKPLIPLPAEIVVETGEENEEVLFEDRAKLYRFVDQEWKERGIGFVKILYDEGSSRVRLLMRRDQVLKVCANHYITSNMEILPLKNSDKAWTWVAPDFADEELRPEHFCIRFKTPEIAAVFKSAFEKAISISKDAETTKVTSPKMSTTIVTFPLSQKPFGGKFLPKAGSWTCPTCYVSNTADKLLCIACETKKPGSQASTATSVTSTVTSLSSENISPFQTTAMNPPFSFGFPAAASLTSTITSTVSSANPPKSVFGGFTFSSNPVIQEAETPELKDREILVVSTKSKDGPQVTKVTTPKTSPFTGFSFKSPTVTTTVSSSESATSLFTGFTFKSSAVPATSTQPSIAVDTSPHSDISSSQPSTSTVTPANISILSIQSSMQNINPAFVFSKTIEKCISSTNEVTNTQSKKPESLFISVSNEGRRVSTGAPETAPEEFVPTAEFKPVVPLPALVDVKTGEENEEKLFGERAKLFRFNSETKEWKERGTGEIKILFLKESHRYRVLMRREQVLKLCANHYILPEMKLTPLNNSDRAWIWITQDYSEGEMIQVKLAVKFKNSDIAQQFFRVFEKCQNELLEYTNNNPPNPCAGNKNAFDKLLQPAVSSWTCSKCSKSNMNRSSCVYCQEIHNETTTHVIAVSSLDQKASENSKLNKDVSKTAPIGNASVAPPVKTDKPLSELFKPQAGSWECDTCLVRNNADATKCASCEAPKPGITSASQPCLGKFQFGSDPAPSFGFGDSKSNDFVFGMKPATQPTTFSFGLTDLSNKSNEVTGFKPTFSTTNEPAMFGGATQKTDSPFSGLGTTALKTDSPVSIFGGAPKSDSSVTVSSIFGGTSKKTDSSLNSSIFGGIAQKTESASIFGASTQSTDMPKNIFGGVAEKSEAKAHPDTSQGTVSVSSTPQSVFSFGSASQKSDSAAFEFRFGSPQKYEFNFSGVRPRSPTKTPKSPRSPATPSDVEDEEENESFDADNIYFQPVIPLPPKVDVKTGEENETTLFCKRAKLFRFCSGEWKERGIGEIKILQDDEDSKKVRLLMRREQVLKVCLNHYLTQDIVFEKRNDKTLSWAATDFSENESSDEIFALKFKTSEFTDEFKATVNSALSSISKPASSVDVSKAVSTFSFKTDNGSKTETSFTTGSLSSVFRTSVSLFDNSTSTETASTSFSFPFKDTPTTGMFFSGQNASGDKGFTFNKASGTTDTSEDDEVQIVYEAVPSPEEVELAKQLQLPPTFFLYKNKPPCPGCIGCEDFLPPAKPVNEPEKTEKTETNNVNSNTSVSQEAEITLFKTGKDVIGFGELATQSGLSGFSISQKKGFEGAGTPLFANLNNSTEGDRDDDTVAQGPDIHFEPVIPLPELVEVKTGEEDETPVFVHRAKLFKYDGAKKEWKERGVGDLKILKHKEKLRFRIILRREQVHKIACNHCIEPNMVLSPLATSDSALCWNALDYSEAQAEASQFAVRLKTKDLLQEFRKTFNECKELLKQAENESSLQVHDTSAEIQNSTPKESPAKHTTEYSDSTESSAESQNDHDHSGSESNEDEQDSDDDSFIFEKRCSFEISEGNEDKFKQFGPGTLKILYDDAVYGYHIYMMNDSEQCLCDHIIAINNCLRMENKKVASWAAVDLSVDPPRRRQFRATFSSVDALKEFNTCFQDSDFVAAITQELKVLSISNISFTISSIKSTADEVLTHISSMGKDAAVQSEIVEKTDCIYSSSG